MASIPNSLHLPFPSTNPSTKLLQPHLTQTIYLPPIKPAPVSLNLPKHCKLSLNQTRFILKASENGAQTSDKEPENPTITNQERSSEEQLSELGTEIKKAMKEREKVVEDSGFWGGVVEEIGQIEWPDFGKVIGTTGVVLGVIAGSSVVLLTVNFVLAELSDKVFAGKGVQDFFGG